MAAVSIIRHGSITSAWRKKNGMKRKLFPRFGIEIGQMLC